MAALILLFVAFCICFATGPVVAADWWIEVMKERSGPLLLAAHGGLTGITFVAFLLALAAKLSRG